MEENLKATCNKCGFSGNPDDFDACLSTHHDLRCPKCGTTNIDWNYESYKGNALVLNEDK